MLEHDIYHQWNKATSATAASLSVSSTSTSTSSAGTSMEVPLPLPYLDVWQTHFQPILQHHHQRSGNTSSSIDSGGKNSGKNSSSEAEDDASIALRFQCTSCQHTIPAVTLAEQVAEMCQLVHDLHQEQTIQNNHHNHNSNYLTKCFELLRKLSLWMNTSTNCYALIEVYRQHLLDELLLQQRFDQYLQVVRSVDYLVHLNSCYPSKGHPILSTQAAMVAKALLFVCTSQHDVKEAHALLVSAEEQLRIAYGGESPIVRDIQGMLSSL